MNTVIEYDGSFHHRDTLENDTEKTRLLLENGFHVIRIREKGLNHLDIIHKNLKIYQYKRNGDPSVNLCIKHVLMLMIESPNITVDQQNKITQIIESIDINRDTIPILSQLPDVIQKNNILDKNQQLEKEWDYEKNYPFRPEHFKLSSNYSVWWRCNAGHSFNAKITSRSKVLVSRLLKKIVC